MIGLRLWTFIVALILTTAFFILFAEIMPTHAASAFKKVLSVKFYKIISQSPENKINVRKPPARTVSIVPAVAAGSPGGGRVEKISSPDPPAFKSKEGRKKDPPLKRDKKNPDKKPAYIPPVIESKTGSGEKTALTGNHDTNFSGNEPDTGVLPVSKPGGAGGGGDDAGSGNSNIAGGGGPAGNFPGGGGTGDAVKRESKIDQRALLLEFQAKVSAKLDRAKIYPDEAREKDQEGIVMVSFLIRPDGGPQNPSVSSSSGYAVLDRAALDAVARAGPYLPFPEGFPTGIKVKAEVIFKLSK
ncbi:MAG: energy transducer TonB [Chloroflexi bacterium]|nr:energy transducer TonB [Chloroflexota bacterium]